MNLRTFLLKWVSVLLIGLVKILPIRLSYAMGRWAALAGLAILPHLKRTGMRNLDIAFGDRMTPREKRELLRRSVVNLAQTMVEFILFASLPPERIRALVVEEVNISALDRALSEKKGSIGVALHIGNWELSGAYPPLTGRPLAAVGREQGDPLFTNIAFSNRSRTGISNIPRLRKMSSALLRALNENQILGLLLDQNAGRAGIYVAFFGKLAATFRGPAELYIRFRAPVILAYAIRIAPMQFKFVAEGPIHYELTGEKKRDVYRITQDLTNRLERIILTYPDQWFWVHNRWKSKPEDEEKEWATLRHYLGDSSNEC